MYRTVLAADLPPGIVDSLPDDAPYSILAALSQHGFEAIVIVPIENQCHVDLLADAPCDVQVQRLGSVMRPSQRILTVLYFVEHRLGFVVPPPGDMILRRARPE